jgi:deazaflavin-dependent oxidoreductase (nitroreductase family)
LFAQEHGDRYRETDGEEGHDWQGTTVLLLTTTGRNSGAKRTTPLIYQRHGEDYLVVASNGGGDPPGWLLDLQDDPIVAVQVKADHQTARARVATAEEKPELRFLIARWPGRRAPIWDLPRLYAQSHAAHRPRLALGNGARQRVHARSSAPRARLIAPPARTTTPTHHPAPGPGSRLPARRRADTPRRSRNTNPSQRRETRSQDAQTTSTPKKSRSA